MTETFDLPAHWAPYLINGDATGFSLNDDGGDAEIELIDSYLEDHQDAIISVSEEPFFSKYHDAIDWGVKACTCLEYTFITLGA